MHHDDCHCSFRRRLADADGLVRAGAWASGHAIASHLLDCARRAGCPASSDCAAAAGSLIGAIRTDVADGARR